MPNVLWGGIQNDEQAATVQSTGLQPGPPGGDGWQIVGRLPTSKLQAGRHYAFVITGHVQALQFSGATPVRGMVQVCLGDAGGLKHPEYRSQIALADSAGSTAASVARPFQFVVLFTPSISDPLWGPTWSNAFDLVLWARCFRNGDAANYAAQFEVAAVTWLWWDLDAVPLAMQNCEEYYPARPPSGSPALNAAAGASPTGHFLTAQVIGSPGQTWLHFVNLWFSPRGNGAGSARFEHGHVTDGTFATFHADVGTNLRWGTDTRGTWLGTAGQQDPTQQLGSFFPLVRPSGTFAIGFRGVDQHAVASRQTLVHRWRVVSIRVDQLPNFAALTVANGSQSLQAGARIELILQQPYVPWEPGPQVTSVAKPVILAHGILAVASPGSRSHSWWIHTNQGRFLWAPGAFINQRSPVEGLPVLGFGEQGLGPGGLDEVQYRFQFLRNDGEPLTTVWPIQDAHFVQFWFVQDPTVDTLPAVPPSNPIVLVPGREGLALAAQLTLPVAPDGAVQEDAGRQSNTLRGPTGYTRSWPRFSIARRFWSLTWAVLRSSERDTLDAFFIANRAFKWKPPGDSEFVAAAFAERPTFTLVDPAGLWSCQVRVAELVHVGP